MRNWDGLGRLPIREPPKLLITGACLVLQPDPTPLLLAILGADLGEALAGTFDHLIWTQGSERKSSYSAMSQDEAGARIYPEGPLRGPHH